jgi:transcriptional regulator with XRE-family HTH domain
MTYAATQLESELLYGYARPYVSSSSFGRNVRQVMGASGISQTELLAELQVKQGTLSDWLRDRRGVPEGPTLLKFAKALRVPIDRLLVGVDDEYDAIVTRSVTEVDQGSALPSGGAADVVSSDLETRLVELERERDEYIALFNQMQDAASRLVKIAAAARGAKGRAVARTERGRGSRHRKTG